MNARNTLFAMFALGSLAASAFGQDWTSEATYTKTVTTTTVTTYSPLVQTTDYVQPWNNAPDAAPVYAPAPQPQAAPVQPTFVQANYMQPTYAAGAYNEAVNVQTNYVQPAYSQPNYVQPSYVQPTYVSYGQPVSMPVSYARAAYVQPAYARPVVYTQPAYVVRPVVANYYSPVYRPVVTGYTPTYVANPATCEVPVAQPVVSSAPIGPKVWVQDRKCGG